MTPLEEKAAKVMSALGNQAFLELRKRDPDMHESFAFVQIQKADDRKLLHVTADGRVKARTQTDAQVAEIISLGLGALLDVDEMPAHTHAQQARRADVRTRQVMERLRGETPEPISADDAKAELATLRGTTPVTDREHQDRASRTEQLLRARLAADGAGE